MNRLHQGPFTTGLVVSGFLSIMIMLCPCISVVVAEEAAGPGRATYIIPSIDYRMVYIPPGTFMMGSPMSEKGRYHDETPHPVRLTRGFFMGVTEVTREQWRIVMGKDPSDSRDGKTRHPVDQVSWNECRQFILKLNRLEKSRKYRLPTEAEWEYACRAGSDSALTNGDITRIKCGHDPNLDRVGWYCGNTKEETQAVAQKEPNAWGVYDMHGNAWEWCRDWYGPYPVGEHIDPTGPETGASRVFRGGGWGLTARTCRSAFRDKYTQDMKCRFLGFRLVREAGTLGRWDAKNGFEALWPPGFSASQPPSLPAFSPSSAAGSPTR